MLYHAEAYDKSTAQLVADLGKWKTLKHARKACTLHAHEALTFKPFWTEMWDAEGQKFIYRIVTTPE